MKNLREIRLRCGVSQAQAAKDIGVCRQTIHRYEKGEIRIHPLRLPYVIAAIEKWESEK